MAQKIDVQVLGLDAPPYYLIAAVERSLKRNGEIAKAEEFAKRAAAVESIEGIIELAKEYVNTI